MLLSVFASNWETGDHDGVKSNRECSNSIERWGTGQYLYILVLTITVQLYFNINSHLVFKLCRKHFQLLTMICCCVVHICCKSAPVPGPNVRCQKYWQESKEGTSLKIPALIKSNLRFDQLGR